MPLPSGMRPALDNAGKNVFTERAEGFLLLRTVTEPDTDDLAVGFDPAALDAETVRPLTFEALKTACAMLRVAADGLGKKVVIHLKLQDPDGPEFQPASETQLAQSSLRSVLKAQFTCSGRAITDKNPLTGEADEGTTWYEASRLDLLNDIWLVTITGATGGTFTITVNGEATGDIAYDASAATVQSALEALTTVGAGNVDVSGDAGGPYTIEFLGDFAASVMTVTADGALLTGEGTPTIEAERTDAGELVGFLDDNAVVQHPTGHADGFHKHVTFDLLGAARGYAEVPYIDPETTVLIGVKRVE